jgi:apolipoprotein N-acyltransferase
MSLSTRKNFLINLALLLCGSLVFALSHPGFLFANGLSFLAWFAYIPVFILVRRASFKTVWLYGFVYGMISYALFVSWLVIFSPAGSIAILLEYGVILMVTFLLLKAAAVFFPVYGWIVQWVVWCGYEYLKTKGFGGFSYGVTAYSQWRNPVFLQCADIAGVWGLSALITFLSAWFSNSLFEALNTGSVLFRTAALRAARKHLFSLVIWGVFFVFAVVYGFVSPKEYSAYPRVKVAAMQQNTDPWKGGLPAYKNDITTLMNLTDKALAADPDISIVLWPETSVVPPVMLNYDMRGDRDRFDLIKNLLEFINSKKCVFVVGNDHAVDRGGRYTDDYNAALVFVPGKNVIPPDPEIYRKNHLVPFTEYFPYGKWFPGLYEALLNGDTHMWTPGTELTVFDAGGLHFSTPICFEDTFGDIGRGMFNNGARALLNMSNDAWSKSQACQNQHLSMAVFRSVENRIPAVRSTASGQTCIVNPNGKVTVMAPSFEKTYITGTVPVISQQVRPTLYARFGDLLGKIFAAFAGILLFVGIILQIFRKHFGVKKLRKDGNRNDGK